MAKIKRAVEVKRNNMPRDDADRSCDRDRHQKSDEAEQLAECEQREHEPHWVQPDRISDKLRSDHVPFEELARPRRRPPP